MTGQRKRKKADHDFSVVAFRVVQEATADKVAPKPESKSSKGGKARASKLTQEERREIAKKAAKARWSR